MVISEIEVQVEVKIIYTRFCDKGERCARVFFKTRVPSMLR